MKRSVWAIVVAAGSGTRFGGAKQFEEVAGRRVLERAIDGAAAVADGVVVVLPARSGLDLRGVRVAEGGPTRSASVRAGLALVPDDADIVVVHDAARPLASAELFRAVVGAVQDGADAAVPGIALTDTVKRVEDDGGDRVVRETVDRDALVAVQTPQAFRAEVLRSAHATGADASDDAALAESAGARVVVVAGERGNLKITFAADLDAAARLITS